ncbi:MAG: potassium transporter TrkG [Oligoflexus sp.]
MNLLTLERFRPRDLTFLLHLGPLFLIYILSLPEESFFFPLGTRELTLAVSLSVMLTVATALLIEQKPFGRWLVQLILLIGMALTINHHYQKPSVCLLVAVVVMSTIKLIHNIGLHRIRSRSRQDSIDYSYEMTYYSIIFNFLTAIAVYFLVAATGPMVFAAVLYGNMLTLSLVVLSSKRSILSLSASIFFQLALLVLIVISITFLSVDALQLASRLSLLIPCISLFLLPIRRQFHLHLTAYAERIFRHPEGAVIMFFLFLSFVGTLILYSPLSSIDGTGIALVDAAFTAVSAACINGLVVLDTPQSFSIFGQAMILLLIQAGGLGIMSMSSLFFLILGQRMSVNQEEAIFDTIGHSVKGEVFSALKLVLKVTFTLELIGATLLSLMFLFAGDSLPTALWRGLFTAISAFCNAGFALQSDSLLAYQGYPAIVHTVGLLVIAGSISPAFVIAIPRMLKGKKTPLQFKIVAFANVLLLFSGLIGFLILEWNQSLVGMGFFDKLHNSWFQSLTTRSSGFNTIDLTALHPATIFLMTTLMFIGGSPGGTGGGIKTTTFMILVYTVISVARGRGEVEAFERNISKSSVFRATTVASTGLLVGFIGLLSLLTTQRVDPIAALFDVVSASANVGLSLGAIAELDQVGKMIIMILMFLGRVGTLSVILYLGQQTQVANWKHAEEDVSAA